MSVALEIEFPMLVVGAVTSGYLLFRALWERSVELSFASIGWAFLSFHVLLRILGYFSLAETFLYFFALGFSLYVVSLIRDMYPSKTHLFALYLLTPASHVVFRFMSSLGYQIQHGLGGIAGDSGVILLITGYIAYRTFKKLLLSLSVVPIAVVFLLYKALSGTLVGLVLMALGAVVFSVATIRVTASGLFKGGETPEVSGRGLVIVKDIQFIPDKYRNSPVFLITRRVREYPSHWSVFRILTVPAESSVSPTALEKLRHLIVKYLVEARRKGSKGLVVIDCIDFLLLYNDRLAVLKFLSDIRDHAVINDGVIYVALDSSIDERTRRLIENLSDGEIKG